MTPLCMAAPMLREYDFECELRANAINSADVRCVIAGHSHAHSENYLPSERVNKIPGDRLGAYLPIM